MQKKKKTEVKQKSLPTQRAWETFFSPCKKTCALVVHTFSRVQLALFSISVLILTLLQTQSMQLCQACLYPDEWGKNISLILRMRLK